MMLAKATGLHQGSRVSAAERLSWASWLTYSVAVGFKGTCTALKFIPQSPEGNNPRTVL